MEKAFTEIVSRGILLALRQHVFRARELGLLENQYCFGCQQHVQKFPLTLFDIRSYDILSEILPMCTGQKYFQLLCTRVIECTLLGMVWAIANN